MMGMLGKAGYGVEGYKMVLKNEYHLAKIYSFPFFF